MTKPMTEAQALALALSRAYHAAARAIRVAMDE
jgi:hypothetical protein